MKEPSIATMYRWMEHAHMASLHGFCIWDLSKEESRNGEDRRRGDTGR